MSESEDESQVVDLRHLWVPCPACGEKRLGRWDGPEPSYECLDCGWTGDQLPPGD